MFFDFGRSQGLPTQYAANQTPVTVDILEAGFITAFLILFVCMIILVPSTNSRASWSSFARITVSLYIGLFIFLSNFGQNWEVGQIVTRTPYRAGIGHEIDAHIGVKIGLRSVNVTLKSITKPTSLEKEIIDYNERFSWEWDQGRFGFGPYAGRIQREFREAQYRGTPLPILWVVDYFVIDGEGYRHGRFYRTAGWYSHIAIWTAFPCWLLANILFRSVINYGAYFLALTGGLLLTANLLWLVIRNPLPLVIPFENASIVMKFGFSYWLNFVNGLLCLILSGVIIFMHYKYDTSLYIFFGVDPLNSYDETYLTKEEEKFIRKKTNQDNMNDTIELKTVTNQLDQNVDPPQTSDRYLFKRSTIRKPALPRRKKYDVEQEPIYENRREEDNEYASFA